MKRRIVALMLACALVSGTMIACGTTDTTTESVSYASETIYGEVTAVSDTGFTMTVGTYDESTSAMTLGDDTVEVTVNDDTTYSMAGMGEAPSGDAPSTDGSSDSSAPAQPEGDASSSDSSSTDTQTPPNKPDDASGDSSTTDTADANASAPEAPADGEAPSGDGSADTSAPSGDGTTDGEAPADGEAPSGDGSTDGAAPSGQPGGDMEISLSSISEGTQVSVTYDADGNVSEVAILGGMSGMGGGQSSSADIEYTAVNTYDSDATVDGETIESTGTDENAILVTAGNVTITNTTVTRDSDDSTGGDNSSFYGVGASVLTTGGTSYIDNLTVNSDAAGGAGVYSYGDGVTYVANSTITTQQNTSGGIHVAGGGTLYAYDLDVTTNGESAAAVRSDRGGGTMVVDGGTYTSNGTGSPAVYCTADIAINDATLTATGAEAVCIEGLNSLYLFDSDLTGDIPESEQNDCDWNIILYQSMSGDSEVGNSTFSMNGGSITAKNGGMFYTTNTESTFVLENVDITYADDNDFFLKVTGNSNQRGWGTSGENGADCTFTAIDQEMEGDVIWDSISTLEFYMTSGSTLTGAFVDDESNAGNGGNGYANLYVSSDSTWVVTADSTLTSLSNEGTIVDANGKTVTIKGTDGTVYVQGDSSITVTVDSYSTSADMSGASSSSSFSDYEVAKPSQLS